MKIAIPTVNEQLARHFGHCQEFTIFDVDEDTGSVEGSTKTDPPPHEPGVLPRWLHQQGVDVVLAGGMGRRAQGLFEENDIEVVVGARPEDPEKIVKDYLSGRLVTGDNPCGH
jgi:predicted Fe-Mo cluster-binding NifX family protein